MQHRRSTSHVALVSYATITPVPTSAPSPTRIRPLSATSRSQSPGSRRPASAGRVRMPASTHQANGKAVVVPQESEVQQEVAEFLRRSRLLVTSLQRVKVEERKLQFQIRRDIVQGTSTLPINFMRELQSLERCYDLGFRKLVHVLQDVEARRLKKAFTIWKVKVDMILDMEERRWRFFQASLALRNLALHKAERLQRKTLKRWFTKVRKWKLLEKKRKLELRRKQEEEERRYLAALRKATEEEAARRAKQAAADARNRAYLSKKRAAMEVKLLKRHYASIIRKAYTSYLLRAELGYRVYLTRRRYVEYVLRQNRSASKIAAVWKGWHLRRTWFEGAALMQAYWRGHHQRNQYLHMKLMASVLQNNVRQFLARRHLFNMVVLIQSRIRGYLGRVVRRKRTIVRILTSLQLRRKWKRMADVLVRRNVLLVSLCARAVCRRHYIVKRRIHRAELAQLHAQRKQKRLQRETARLFQIVVRISHQLHIVCFSQPVTPVAGGGIQCNVFNPASCARYSLVLSREHMKRIIDQHYQSPQELRYLFAPVNLTIAARQLRYGGSKFDRRVIISRSGEVESGQLLSRCARRLEDGRLYVLSSYRNAYGYYVKGYMPDSCFRKLRLDVSADKLAGLLRSAECPELLQLKHSQQLAAWILSRVAVCWRPKCGFPSHRLQHEQGLPVLSLELSEKEEGSILRIQRAWRRHLVHQSHLKYLHKVAATVYKKQYDRRSGCYYYVNPYNASSSWTKPWTLGPLDIEPIRGWQRSIDTNGQVIWFDAETGQFSRISEEQAAMMLQRSFRRRQAHIFLLSMADVKKAVNFMDKVPSLYARDPHKIANLLNYALFLQTLECDYVGAKAIYDQLETMKVQQPAFLFSAALFRLAADVQYPRQRAQRTAQAMLTLAFTMTPEYTEFKPAIACFFKWGLILQPRNALALLNLALVKHHVEKDYFVAETLYRRAMRLEPSNPHVTQNATEFEEMMKGTSGN